MFGIYVYSYLTQSPSPPPLTTKPATKQQLINNSDKKSGDKLETLDMIQFIGLIWFITVPLSLKFE